MANIKSGYVQGDKDYINLEEALGLSLVKNHSYCVQVLGEGIFCESSTKPSEGGTKYDCTKDKPFYYIKKDEYLWVKLNPNQTFYVNFSE